MASDDKTIKPGDVMDLPYGLKGVATQVEPSDGEYWELTRHSHCDDRRRWRYEFAARAIQGIISNTEMVFAIQKGAGCKTQDDGADAVVMVAVDTADRLLAKLESTDPEKSK